MKSNGKNWLKYLLLPKVYHIVSPVHSNNSYQTGKQNQPVLKTMISSVGHYVEHHKIAKVLIAIGIPLSLTLIDWPFRETLKPSNILLVYLLGVFFVAIHLGLWPSILSLLSCAPLFAFFFGPPIFSLAITDQENIVGLAVMLVVGVISSKQAAKIRFQMRIAQDKEQRILALYQLSKALAEAPTEREIIEIGVRHIHSEFGGQNTLLFPDHKGKLVYPVETALDYSLHSIDLNVARWVFSHGQMAGQGALTFPEETAVYLPLTGSTGAIGVLVVKLQRSFLPEQQQLLETFVNQIVHTLERAHLAEQAKEVTLKMQSETLRNSLLSSISHDLRTPLATIVGAASTLETDEDRLSENSRRKLVAVISEGAQRMSDLTIKILEMARLEAGDVVLNRQWYEPEEIIASALRRLDKKLKTRQVNVQIPENLALINVDAVLLQQVMVNLLDNADKYSPAGLPIEISVNNTQPGLSIAVSDRGPGIPDGFREKIFDKFFQIHAESAQSGVGLGLSICRAIVEAHGGEILVINRHGGGSEFQVNLPNLACPPTIAPEENREIL